MDIEYLFRAHYAQMRRLAVALLHDDDAARDAVHDVFASLLDSRRPETPQAGYLMRAVRNHCLNEIREKDIHGRIAKGNFLNTDEYDDEEWPDEATIAAIYSIVRERLPEQCRRVVELRFYTGMDYADIAREMSTSLRTVFRNLRQALIIIRNTLGENG